ncbi:GGDEF domain-containing protein [Pseudomonas sp. HMWF032]|uniref:GGDEF domain-containing protein n=1 Tax=Pseudomonas sp. HMWF032 TaxID=2056866 RepID=UPI000D3B51DA|nr:GGDEF domain-containing protein [Pseudomonas sp. HMWF032]PTS85965.1 GGDEF domain-containing protein [Pseudomonas sp. HMWF032]PTT82648.1 GGDEF domain-containing protein [Pseudomonas sp. HMWF010]
MTEAHVPRESAAFALWREAQDTRNRSPLGGAYYLLAWFLTWVFSNEPDALIVSGLIGLVTFALLLALRVLHRLPAQQNDATLRRWLNFHWGLILLTALSWGLAHAFVHKQPLFSDSAIIATLSTIAFSTALAFNFAMRKRPAILALLLLYLPGLLSLAMDWQEQHAILITLSFYLSYLLLALSRSHREYHNTLALERQLLEQQKKLEQLSRTDSLTQLGNRYQFNNLFPAMVANAQRQHQPLSLVLLDIDYFKRINDQYGHICGDHCLSAFAERMRQNFRRDSDALLRLGGEEFGILMPNTRLEEARQMAERFRQELEREGFSVPGTSLPLTASLGVGCFDTQLDGTAEAFFKRVDDALYQAKNAGRNRIELA